MRILLVDSDARLVDGLQRALMLRRASWEIDTATSGTTALERLTGASYDVMVTALRLTGLDGVALMERARAWQPEMSRVVLSATAAGDEARRAVPLGHQFLAKPCTTDTLEAVLERAGRLRSTLASKELRRLIGRLDQLPAAPSIYAEIVDAMADPELDARGLARIVARDPMVAAKVMQLANAPLFARARPVGDVAEAVTYLGQERVRDLVLAAEVYGGMARGHRGERLAAIQQHAITVAALARRIPRTAWLAELAFTAGLMHDVGAAVLAVHMPERAAAAAEVARQRDIPMVVAERLLDGVSHAEVGAYLLDLWGLPAALVDAVAHHHTPVRDPEAQRLDLAGVIHVADLLVHGEEVDAGYARRTHIDHLLPEWRRAAGELARHAGATTHG